MLSLRLHANPDKVCYRNCYALSNIRLFVSKQTYVKDMSIPPLVCGYRRGRYCVLRSFQDSLVPLRPSKPRLSDW